ncbi:MAG: N-acetyltransferase [Clostridiales bacterium]|nr:N-acetyltransferase [Clostridiales bacterium]
MEKCGLRYEGTLKEHSRLRSTGEREDIIVRGILREEFLKQYKN